MNSFRFISGLFILIILLIISILIVPEPIDPNTRDEMLQSLLWSYRIPKAITALLTGASLAVSGFILQQIFRNNLAGPYILGISSGASLAVAFYIIGNSLFFSQGLPGGIPLAGFLGSMLVLLLVLGIAGKFGSGSIILLFGVIIAQICGALQSLLNYIAIPGDLKYFTLWSMGSFSRVIGTDLIILSATTGIGLVCAFFLMPSLSVMLLGNDVAGTLGVNIRKTTFRLLLLTGILCGVCTAYCGPIAFIGMAVPNASRLLFRSNEFRSLMLFNAILGGAMAMISELVASFSINGMHIPVNVSAALLGGPFIIYVLLFRRH